MVIINSYLTAVILLFVTMLCWGSWANTQKLATKSWPFQLFYWDYTIGVVLMSLLFAVSMGSFGLEGRSFLIDISQGSNESMLSAFLGGIIFNIANLLLVAAIDIAGMAVAFPIGIGIATCLSTPAIRIWRSLFQGHIDFRNSRYRDGILLSVCRSFDD
jgi:glucose uptake protein